MAGCRASQAVVWRLVWGSWAPRGVFPILRAPQPAMTGGCCRVAQNLARMTGQVGGESAKLGPIPASTRFGNLRLGIDQIWLESGPASSRPELARLRPELPRKRPSSAKTGPTQAKPGRSWPGRASSQVYAWHRHCDGPQATYAHKPNHIRRPHRTCGRRRITQDNEVNAVGAAHHYDRGTKSCANTSAHHSANSPRGARHVSL